MYIDIVSQEISRDSFGICRKRKFIERQVIQSSTSDNNRLFVFHDKIGRSYYSDLWWRKMLRIKHVASLLLLITLLISCNPKSQPTASLPTESPTEIVVTTEPTEGSPDIAAEESQGNDDEPVEPINDEIPEAEEPVQITGTIEISNLGIVDIYFNQRFVILEDLTGFVQRDFEYQQPIESQILGPIILDEDGNFTYTLNLPAAPISPLNDVDNNASENQGVQLWQVSMRANYIDDPFLGEDETAGWKSNYTSARIDSENKNEIIGGVIIVWAPDDQQAFPSGFGEDGLLFTEDDPTELIEAGYTFVYLDEEPFKTNKESIADLILYEGELTVNDFSELSWSEGFEALHNKMSAEYPFTEMKGLDWDALYDEYSPLISDAESRNDETAYYLALRDYSWSIPDGHIALGGSQVGSQMFNEEVRGGFGFGIIGLDDGRVIVHILQDIGPAVDAGIQWGAEILRWNGIPIQEAIDQVTPWSMPFSTEETLRLEQYRFLLRNPIGTEVEVVFQNPDDAEPITAKLTSVFEPDTYEATSPYAGRDRNSLPVEYEILPSGEGYIKISSLSEDINLIIRLWEWAIERMITNQVPAIIIDLRQNAGGSPLGTYFASFFVEDRIDISRSYYFSEKSGQFETFGPPDYTEPDDKLYYDGQLAVLVSPACASACENVSYVLGELPQTRIFGYYASKGIYGEVARGQYQLPEGYSFQTPTGMTKDLDGNIIIEGTGVVPDVRVPLTEENVRAEYVDERDVVLDFVIDVLSQPLGAGLTPEHPPKIATKTDAQTAFQARTEWFEQISRETYEEAELSQAGETYIYTIPLNRSRDLMWVYVWCTPDETSYIDNWSKIEVEFAINGDPVRLQRFVEIAGRFGDSHCRAYYTLLNDWAPGEHIITTTVTFTDRLNNGIQEEDFPAGTHVYEYHVIVVACQA